MWILHSGKKQYDIHTLFSLVVMCVPERNTNEVKDCNWLYKATLHMNCQYTNPINLLKARGNYM